MIYGNGFINFTETEMSDGTVHFGHFRLTNHGIEYLNQHSR
jgi:hypothetical protein